MRIWIACMLAAACAGGARAQSPSPSIAQTVRERMAQQILSGAAGSAGAPGATSTHLELPKILRSQKPDGSWSDIDYASHTRSEWAPSEHLHRLFALVLAEHDPKPLASLDTLQDAVRRGLGFWVQRDPQSDNWWWNTIGMQQALAPVLVLARDDLIAHAPDAWRGACAQMERSHVDKMTGTNLVWEAYNRFTVAALTDDETEMRRMTALAIGTVRVTTDEGIQPDESYHQHGPQLNAGNYGISFGSSVARWALVVRDTPLGFPASALSVLSAFEADFQEWTVWGRFLDLSSCGRQLDEPDAQTGKARAIAQTGTLLGELQPRSAPYWQRLADRVAGTLAPGVGAPRGDRYYWRSDYLVHRPGQWYFSVKMYSPRVLRTETQVNDENYRGYHLCDGMTQVLVRGDEYENIQPVWDWRKLPGITFKETSAPLPYGAKAAPTRNPRPFVGGAALAPVSVAAMDIQKEDVFARKAYFCFPDGVVCLGEDIACPAQARVCTDVNQCLLKGPVVPLSTLALWHDNVAYVRMDGTPWTYTAGPQTGSWALLKKETSSNAPQMLNVFNLWLDHGVAPTRGHYAYTLLPGVTVDQARIWLKRPRFRVITNSTIQAVADQAHHLIGAVCHGPGSVPGLGGGEAFYVDAPCIVIARTSIPGHITVAVADPTQTLSEVHILLVGRKAMKIVLPKGPQAGSTVVATE